MCCIVYLLFTGVTNRWSINCTIIGYNLIILLFQQRNDYYESNSAINRLSVHPFYNDEGNRSISAPLYCKMRIRASSVTSSTSSWSFVSTSQQVFSESSQSDNSEQQIHAALNNRNAFSEARLPSIAHMNNLHDRHPKPNKTTKGGANACLLLS